MAGAKSIYRSVAHTIMEVFVLTVVIVSTIICVASLVGEVWGSIKYYIKAAKIRYRSMTKRNSRKIVKNRPVPKVESALSGRTDDRWVAAQQSLTALKAKGKLRNKAASLQATMLNVLIDREDVQPEAVQEYITNHAGLTTPAAGSGKEGGKDGKGGKKGGKSKAVNSLMKQALWSKFYLSLHMHRITGLSVEPGTVLRFLLRVATKTVHFTCEYQERGKVLGMTSDHCSSPTHPPYSYQASSLRRSNKLKCTMCCLMLYTLACARPG